MPWQQDAHAAAAFRHFGAIVKDAP